MKYLLLPAALLLLISCQGNLQEKMKPEHDKTDWAFYKLNGDVHTISERSVKITGETTAQGSENGIDIDYDRTFDDFGYLIHEKKWVKKDVPYEEVISERRDAIVKRTQYTAGKPAIITENEWDAAREHLLGTTRKNPDNTQIDRQTFVYEEGRLTMKVKYNNQDIGIEKIVYGYDKKGNVIKEGIYPNAVIQEFKVAYEYDNANNKILETRSGKNSPVQRTRYSYNGKKMIRKESNNSKGEVTTTEEYTYDAKGNILTHIISEKSGSRSAERFEYDKNNNVTKWQMVTDNDPEVTVSNVYDTENNLTYTKTQVGTEAFDERAYTYQYDEHKNWVKKTVTIKGTNAYKVTRTITYF